MNLLEALPRDVSVAGREYAVYTDFRDWIAFDGLLRDPGVSERDRAALLLDWYEDDLPPPCPEAFSALFGFYLCGEKPCGDSPTKPVFDYRQDMAMLYTAFVQSYGINLQQVDYLHWWEFRALLDSLPEDTKLSKVIGYRAVDLNKLPKGERPRYRELQRMYALGGGGGVPKTLAQRDAELLERARQAARHAKREVKENE